MSIGGRLVAFLLVLLGTFGSAYAVGEKLPGHNHAGHSDADHSDADHVATLVPPGFTSGNYRLVMGNLVVQADKTRVVTFRLETNDKKMVKMFSEFHGALMHVVLVRPDLSGFDHIHPDIAADGSWQVTLDQPGPWHVVFESTPSGTSDAVIVSANLDDERTVEPKPLPGPNDDVTIDGLRVVRSGIGFAVTASGGGPAQGMQPYLGQPAHLIAIRQGDLDFIHLHPQTMDGMLMFGTALPEPGTYRLFLQFGHNGKVLTVPFTVVQP